jgi:Fic family protein
MGDLTLNDILEIHRRVLGFTDPVESGKLRQHQVYVGKFTPPGAHLVKPLMDEFIEWVNSNQFLTEAHPVQIAALVHYKFVYIHPFYDGNGRTGRLLMNLILMKFGYPPVIIKKHQRLDYYQYLEMANQGDARPFIRFIAKCTKLTLKDYIRVCNNSHSISDDSQTGRNELTFSEDNVLFDYLNSEDEGDELISKIQDFDETHIENMAKISQEKSQRDKIIVTNNNYHANPDQNEKLSEKT